MLIFPFYGKTLHYLIKSNRGPFTTLLSKSQSEESISFMVLGILRKNNRLKSQDCHVDLVFFHIQKVKSSTLCLAIVGKARGLCPLRKCSKRVRNQINPGWALQAVKGEVWGNRLILRVKKQKRKLRTIFYITLKGLTQKRHSHTLSISNRSGV